MSKPNVELTDHTFSAPPRGGGTSEKHPYLIVLSGPHFGEMYPLEPGRELTIGRRDGADIRIRDEGVSRRHASIQVQGGAAQLRDLGSQNGTFVEGARVNAMRLEDGARIHLGVSTVLKLAFADRVEAEYQRKLAQGAMHEPLTGLYNRRHFMERLAAELAAAQRHQRALALLFVDIDHFKAVNDRFGHLAGDEVLRMVAYVLQGAVRKEDVLARYGGEEFVVLARETGATGARALAERVRKAVERSRCGWQEHELGVTVSVGAAVLSGLPHYVPGETERNLLAAADRALYQAKAGGRNGSVTSTDLEAPEHP
ncbi:MAG TPA: GGDEF domain-containing protein [Anaeromyxobacteraceae bacterium]|jgi:diguanylate cyclase (GGDEF)-like protein|nr:GGDEF domain-containing protein [Anaeromyxobacteraceae bacterium]